MITFTMREADEYWRNNYGLLYESVETVEVTGNAAHNPHYPHRVQVWESKRCNRAGTHVLQVESMVIASGLVKQSSRLGMVREGDTVRLVYPDGTHADYKVTAQWLRDPSLTPIPTAEEVLAQVRRVLEESSEWNADTHQAIDWIFADAGQPLNTAT